MRETKEAYLLRCSLNGMPMAFFSRHTESTETSWTACFKTKEDAQREIELFKDWQCPYCGKVARNGENKLRHLSKHEPAIRKMLRENFKLRLMTMPKLEVDSED